MTQDYIILAVIIAVKGVRRSIEVDESQASELLNHYGVLNTTRVLDRKDATTTLRVVMTDEPSYRQVIEKGLHINYQHYRCEPWLLPVIMCYKCKLIGHIAAKCLNVLRCSKCAGSHSSLECNINK